MLLIDSIYVVKIIELIILVLHTIISKYYREKFFEMNHSCNSQIVNSQMPWQFREIKRAPSVKAKTLNVGYK